MGGGVARFDGDIVEFAVGGEQQFHGAGHADAAWLLGICFLHEGR